MQDAIAALLALKRVRESVRLARLARARAEERRAEALCIQLARAQDSQAARRRTEEAAIHARLLAGPMPALEVRREAARLARLEAQCRQLSRRRAEAGAAHAARARDSEAARGAHAAALRDCEGLALLHERLHEATERETEWLAEAEAEELAAPRAPC